MKEILMYKQPAGNWKEALPLGNGRLGAMDFGGAWRETLQLDESTYWSGEASEENNRADSRELLAQIREALLEEDYERADELGHGFVGNKNNYGTNLPVGNFYIDCFPEGRPEKEWEEAAGADTVTDFVRRLYLEEARSEVSFKAGGSIYRREVFLSNPAQAAVIHMDTRPGKPFALRIRVEGIASRVGITEERQQDYLIRGQARETLHSDGLTGVNLAGRIRVVTDGYHHLEESGIWVENATRATLLVDLETDMFQPDPEETAGRRLEEAWQKGYERLRQEHIQDVSALYNRMDISLGAEDMRELPTDERLRKQTEGKEDPGLAALLFQYGRYLLIASSREDSPLPTHMGGIWNDNIYNNIDCTQDMHVDMNLQMQYWLAALCALPECYQPAFAYMRDILVPSGEKTAAGVYGAKGWTAHVVTNPWGFTSLGWSYNWGVWSLGGVWCAALIWDYYEFTGDKDFLREWWPALKGAAEFAADYVFPDEKSGFYMTGPSYSPENMFSVDGKEYFLSLSTTCDCILVREILDIIAKGYQELSLERDSFLEKCVEIRENLPPYRIGSRGQLQEWFHDFDEPIPNHRHTSHLLGLYPFSQIRPEEQPQLAQAAYESIRRRLEDFEITSWGMNMLMGYYARLCDGEKALAIYQDTLRRLVKPNLSSVMSDETSMWAGTWELDGNTGLTASMAEMLVQSHGDVIRILPALPDEWRNGYVKGICLRGGQKADIYWRDGIPEKVVFVCGKDEKRLLCYGDQKQEIDLKTGERKEYSWKSGKFEIVQAGLRRQ